MLITCEDAMKILRYFLEHDDVNTDFTWELD